MSLKVKRVVFCDKGVNLKCVMVRNKALIRFVMVGGVCFATNFAVLFCGTGVFGWHYLISMAVSIVVANTLGWLLNRRWTFAESGDPWWKEYFRYLSVSLSSTLIGLGLMVLCVSVMSIHYLLSNAMVSLLMLLFNFIAHRDWSFSGSKRSSPRS